MLDYDLCMAATYRCVEAVSTLNFDHFGKGGALIADQLISPVTGGRYPSVHGENISCVHSTGAAKSFDIEKRLPTMDANLKSSPTHYANIIQPMFTRCGIGLAILPGSDNMLHTVYVQFYAK